MASSPLIIVPTTTSVAAVLVSVKARPGNDGACGQGRATADLDKPCARRPQHVWVGAKKRDARPTGRSALCRPHGLARRERQKTPGEGADPFRQRSGSTRHDRSEEHTSELQS